MKRSTRTIRRGIAASIAVAATAVALGAGPAGASTVYNGSTVTAYGTSSMINHVLTVSPTVQPMAGYSSQRVYYEIASTDTTAGTTKYFGWYGPYTVAPTTIPPTNCNQLTQTGCMWITQPAGPLPGQTLWGIPGHSYRLWVQVAYQVGSGFSYGPWTLLDGCRTYYQSSGITLNSNGMLCWT